MADKNVKDTFVVDGISSTQDSSSGAQNTTLVPQGVTPEEAEKIKQSAITLAQQLIDAAGSKELEIADSMAGLGIQAQRQAASELGLLKAKVKDLCGREGLTNQVTGDLVDLRIALKQIVPPELKREGLLPRIMSFLPLRRRLLRILEKIALSYEPVSRQVAVIETRLREGRTVLARDNVELRKLYERVEVQQPAIMKFIFMGEVLSQQLDELMNRVTNAKKREAIRNALYDVTMRIQDLRAMAEVHSQFFVSMEMTRQNNTRLAQAVDRTLTLATNVVTVGLAIQVALARQRRVLEATQRTREFLGDMIVANAENIRRHTEEIGDVYKEPVIALGKITQAHDALVEAIDMANRLKDEGLASARDNISKLNRLAGTLETRISEQEHR
jgi:uncharacterized protein YaaN involved in tellurite resistance